MIINAGNFFFLFVINHWQPFDEIDKQCARVVRFNPWMLLIAKTDSKPPLICHVDYNVYQRDWDPYTPTEPFIVFRTPNGPYRILTLHKGVFLTNVIDSRGNLGKTWRPTSLLAGHNCHSDIVVLGNGTTLMFYDKCVGLCRIDVCKPGIVQSKVKVICPYSKIPHAPVLGDCDSVFVRAGPDVESVALFYSRWMYLIDASSGEIKVITSLVSPTGGGTETMAVIAGVCGPIPMLVPKPSQKVSGKKHLSFDKAQLFYCCVFTYWDDEPMKRMIMRLYGPTGKMIDTGVDEPMKHTITRLYKQIEKRFETVQFSQLEAFHGISISSNGSFLYPKGFNLMVYGPITGQTIRIPTPKEPQRILVHEPFPLVHKHETFQVLAHCLLPDLITILFEFLDNQIAIVRGRDWASITTFSLPRFPPSSVVLSQFDNK